MRILVVDAYAHSRRALTWLLEGDGHQAQGAATVAALNSPELPQDQFRDLTY